MRDPGSLLVGLLGCLGVTAQAPAQEPRTPNELLARGTPTFVCGTAGDDRADAAVAAQVALIRDLLFPTARVVDDVAVDLAAGPDGWPENPILYGGAHVNSLLAALADDLPFRIERGRLTLGGRTFTGDEYRLIALVPRGPRHPAFLLYAGTGDPGVAEINSVQHGATGLLLADRFGPLAVGGFEVAADGTATVRWGRWARRLPWRTAELPLGEGPARLRLARLELIEPRPEEAAQDAACLRGVRRVLERLGLEDAPTVTIHVYPDRGSKRSLTGDAGDGRADVPSRTLHVLPFDAAEGGPLELLVAHEATHVLAYAAWGPVGTPLLGEGLAVWAAGHYGGRSLADWRRTWEGGVPPLAGLLGPGFRRLPEARAYPLGGVLVEVLVAEVGLDRVRRHLLPATSATWEAACTAAGTTAADVERALRDALR